MFAGDARQLAAVRPLCDTSAVQAAAGPFKPGWRNWQTQRTQNPPVLSTLGVQLPLPAPRFPRAIVNRGENVSRQRHFQMFTHSLNGFTI